jgi:thiol-disulfide isomerase/thioredoxin
LERSTTLQFLIYTKSFLGIILIALSIYWFRKFSKQEHFGFLKPALFTLLIIGFSVTIKLFLTFGRNNNEKIRFVQLESQPAALKPLIDKHFKNKVVYVDFWGTSCGPCLMEFRYSTKPMKVKYKETDDLAYLYVSQGNKNLWMKQIERFDIEGYHLFLDDPQYTNLYRDALKNDTAIALMPRYMIVDKNGKVVETDAKRPSDKDSLFAQLDHVLNK